MIYIGIDVSSHKHDYCILDDQGHSLYRSTIPNTRAGFEQLITTIEEQTDQLDKVEIGLEATGHYGAHLKAFLHQKGLKFYELNPLAVNYYRHDASIRKAKTDKIDAKLIAEYVRSKPNLTPHASASYHTSELRSLCRYRFGQVRELSRKKAQLSKEIYLLFPELETLVSNLHSTTIYTLLSTYPGAQYVTEAELAHLTNLVSQASRSKFGQEFVQKLKALAAASIGITSEVESFKLQSLLKSILATQAEITTIDQRITAMLPELVRFSLRYQASAPS